jgi:serine/threonine protein kinase/tetratricopeptide (TPR) repeat protein
MIGTRFGQYEITAKLGEGGMGIVYRARDLRLGRQVALKVLPDGFAEDREHITRFEREARLLAALNHPNIAQLYGFETSKKTRALIMELVEGPTLAERLAQAPLPVAECVTLAIQIVQALAEAHRQGIVHRDLKPQNIKLTRGGRIKVLDFGLARQQAVTGALLANAPTLTTHTHSGTMLGTVGYMAPEQVRGAAVDHRADIFAFGCVFYEMATGQRAFGRSTAIETLTAILHETPLPASRLRRELPSGLDRIIARCLEKDPAGRFQSADELESALTSITLPGRSGAVGAPSVAVLPFINLSADPENEFFADGITEDVIAHLAKVRSLKVISRTSVMTFKKRDCGLREISEKLGADNVVEGSVRRAGNRVRIVAQLIQAAGDQHIWAETYDRDLTDIFAIQTDVALNIANALRAELSPDERARIRRRPTDDLEAYDLFLRGRNFFYRFTAEGFRNALIQYEAAVARDPGFALAWAAIAEAQAEFSIEGFVLGSREQSIASAKAAIARALQLDDLLAEAHGISGLIRFVFDFDWTGAESDFRKAIELSPGSAEVHDHYSWMLGSMGRHDEAVSEVQRAHELDPIMVQSDVATALLRAGRVEEALQDARRALRELPGSPRCQSILGWSLIFHGEPAAGIAALEQAAALTPGSTMFLSQLGQACALTGDIPRARAILQQLQERAQHDFVSPYHFAYVHTGLGEYDAAIEWLERAFQQRSGAIYGIKGSFLFKDLRNHPRFQALLGKMNLA